MHLTLASSESENAAVHVSLQSSSMKSGGALEGGGQKLCRKETAWQPSLVWGAMNNLGGQFPPLTLPTATPLGGTKGPLSVERGSSYTVVVVVSFIYGVETLSPSSNFLHKLIKRFTKQAFTI